MGRTPGLNPLGRIQTTEDDKERHEGLEEGEDDLEQPMSPVSRFFHEPGPSVYIIALIGMKTLIDPDLFKLNLVQIMEKNRRLSSLQVLDKRNGSMRWVQTHLNIDDHVIVPEIDQNMECSSDKFLEDYIKNLSRSPIENSKPLWDLHILNVKTSDVEGTYVFRFHHSLGDGLSLMNLLLACSRKASDPGALPTLPSGDKSSSSRYIRVTSFRYLFMFLWNSLVGVISFLSTLLFLKDTRTPFTRSPGAEHRPRRFVLTSVSHNDIKIVKKAENVTVNDVVLGVVESGLYRYLNRRYGESNKNVPKNIRLRAVLPFNMRGSTHVDVFANTMSRPGTWGNKVGCVLYPFNIRSREDALDYVRQVKIIMNSKKASLESNFSLFSSKLLMMLFGLKVGVKLMRIFESRTTIWFSNIPGPQQEILFCGHEVDYLALSCYGQPAALLIHVVSYADKITFMVSVDEEVIPDPETLCDDIQQSLHLIVTSVLATKCVKN